MLENPCNSGSLLLIMKQKLSRPKGKSKEKFQLAVYGKSVDSKATPPIKHPKRRRGSALNAKEYDKKWKEKKNKLLKDYFGPGEEYDPKKICENIEKRDILLTLNILSQIKLSIQPEFNNSLKLSVLLFDEYSHILDVIDEHAEPVWERPADDDKFKDCRNLAFSEAVKYCKPDQTEANVPFIIFDISLLADDVQAALIVVSCPEEDVNPEFKLDMCISPPEINYSIAVDRDKKNGKWTVLVGMIHRKRVENHGDQWFFRLLGRKKDQFKERDYLECASQIRLHMMAFLGKQESEQLLTTATSNGKCYKWWFMILALNIVFACFLIVLDESNDAGNIRQWSRERNEVFDYILNFNITNSTGDWRRDWILTYAISHQGVLAADPEGYNFTVWTFRDAFICSFTLMTTIGYGVITPKSIQAQLACVVFSVVGIPCCAIGMTYFSFFLLIVFMNLSRKFHAEERVLFRHASGSKVGQLRSHKIPAYKLLELLRSPNVGLRLRTAKALEFFLHMWNNDPQLCGDCKRDPNCQYCSGSDKDFPCVYEMRQKDQHNNDVMWKCGFAEYISIMHYLRSEHGWKFHSNSFRQGCLLGLLTITVSIMTIVLSHTEHWTAWEAFYFVWISITTIGFGDYYPHSIGGQATLYIGGLTVLGIVVSFMSTVRNAVEDIVSDSILDSKIDEHDKKDAMFMINELVTRYKQVPEPIELRASD